MNYPVNLFIQDVLHYTPTQASLAFVPTIVTGAVFCFFAARLLHRVGLPSFLLAGLVVEIAAIGVYAAAHPGSSYLAALLPAAIAGQAAFMGIWMALRLAAVAGVSQEDQGVASGAIYSMQQLGNAVGIPALSAIQHAAIVSHGAVAIGDAARLAGFHAMFLGALGFMIVALAAALFLLRIPAQKGPPSSPSLPESSPEPAG